MFSGAVLADALSDAVCIWQFGDWADLQGSPYTDLDGGYVGSTAGVDVSGDGLLPLNSDDWAVQATGYTWMGGINPGELVPTGAVTIFARHKSASFNAIDDIIQVGNGETDWDCVYGISLENADARFIVYGDGQSGQEAPLTAGVTLSADFNMDCYVNLIDFAEFALHYLNGV